MRKLKNIALICLCATLITSCIKDETTLGDKPISKITLVGGLDTLYEVDRMATLRIPAPQITQANEQKELKYEWEVNHKVVSKEKDLVYLADTYGRLPARLKVYNDDNIFYKEFEVNVRYAYGQGLYILASHEGKSIISYRPEGVEGKTFKLDIFEVNNPEIKVGAEPKSIFITNAKAGDFIYVATGNPSVLYRLNGNLLTAMHIMNAQPFITYINGDGTTLIPPRMIMNGHIAETLNLGSVITNGRQQRMNQFFGDMQFADKFLYWKTPDERFTNGEFYYDNLKQRVLIYAENGEDSKQFLELFKGEFTGLKLIDMGLASNKKDVVCVFQNNSGGFKLYWINPGYHYRYNLSKQIAPSIVFSGNIPASADFKSSSLIATSPSRNIMYYSSGNKVYAYSISSSGNYPTQPLFTCGDGGEIASMYINVSESKLYVGVNNPSSAMQGSVYCFDLTTNTLVWKDENVTGKIKQIDYKNF